MIAIRSTLPLVEPPAWAQLERELIARMNEAAELAISRYVREDGTMLWPPDADHEDIDALDDMFESFHNWPLLYMLGGDERLRGWSLRQYDAIVKQFAGVQTGHGHPMVVDEYEQGYDWFHQGEGYLFFYLLNMMDPAGGTNRERAIRYADLYVEETAGNYDAARNVIRSPHSGSMGPGWRNFAGKSWGYANWKRFYGLPFQDVPGVGRLDDVKEEAAAAAMGRALEARQSRGDAAVNLAVTSMVAQAYLHTGDDKYRLWIERYVSGWIERAEANGGVVPDNVGLGGQVGEYTGGKWYGGYYGWTWPHGWHAVGCAVMAAAENGWLVSGGDERYLQFARRQLDALTERGIMHRGTLHVPYKYGDPGWYDYDLWIDSVLLADGSASRPHEPTGSPVLWRDGWFEFQPMEPHFPAHLWHASMAEDDWDRAVKLRHAHEDDARRVRSGFRVKKDFGGNDEPWAAYLHGEYPDYPLHMLRHSLTLLYYRLAFIHHDREDPASYRETYFQYRNPVVTEALSQLMCGAPRMIYNGGLWFPRVRYYDAELRRPGVPDDVAALVSRLTEDEVELELVNLHPSRARRLIVQASGYGEHRIVRVHAGQLSGELKLATYVEAGAPWPAAERTTRTTEIGAPAFEVELAPASRLPLVLEVERHAYKPSYRQPWETA